MSKQFNRALRRSALTIALSACFASPVQAQSNAGSVFGQASAGETITIENPDTGFRRQISVSSDGTYRAAAIQPGTYRVTVTRADGSTTVRDSIVVNAGVGTPVNFGGSAATTLDTVMVTGSRAINPIDVSSVESVTILTADQIAKVPVALNATSVALLAPGTVKGDAAFGNLASFGGASVAENQYYVNGFNVTNSFRSLNFSKIPFEAIQEQQVKTGGYGAEFGRSLGGVVNQITKRGTNEFHAGGNIFYTPSQWTAHTRDVFLTNGTLREDNSNDESSETVASLWASGALIKDRLFAYGLVQYRQTEGDSWGSILSSTNSSESAKDPTYLLKMDWNINDTNLLEFTAFSDKREREIDVYRNDLGEVERNDSIGTQFLEEGGDNYVLKYTGYFTDTFTLSALYGHGEFSRGQYLRTAGGVDVRYGGDLSNPASGCPVIVDARPASRRELTGTYSSTCNITGGRIDREDSADTRDQFRIDGDWMLGDHLLKFGFDMDDYESVAGASYEGGRLWRYSTTASGSDIVREQIVNQGATVEVKQRAFYIQDNWSVTDNFMTYLGLRWDSFENLNGQGQTYVDIENQFGPRLGFSWDVSGDSSLKVYGNAGRYALPLTPSVAVRGASASLYTREEFDYIDVDPVTGAPIGTTPRGTFRYINGEFGEAKNPDTIASSNLDPMYQDEYILGFQKSLNDHLALGVRGIYRDLKTAIDDNCDYTAVLEAGGFVYDEAENWWFDADGTPPALPNAGFPYCRMFNPGSDAVFLTDFYGNGVLTETTIKGDRLSPEAERTYKAIEVMLDGSWDKFFLQASYTWSKSEGNTEGGVKSDIGQADTSVTQDFDYKELTVDTYGYLPNDRRHAFKVFGNYEFTDEWQMGANVLIQSGRPINCLGTLPWINGLHPYGASFMRCNGVAVPRGTAGRLPWTRNLDLNVTYTPSFAEGLTLKMDMFNVLNDQERISVSERGEDGTTGTPAETYLMPTGFQAPRSVRLMVQYEF